MRCSKDWRAATPRHSPAPSAWSRTSATGSNVYCRKFTNALGRAARNASASPARPEPGRAPSPNSWCGPTGGALLGDRIRMEAVSLDPGVFIRSMATRGAQGGLATTTEEVADVLDAFGFDRILIETVGVGQTELDVAATAETTVLVLVPESGDGIQTLKAGVMEIAELYVINKSDRPGADKLKQEVEVMLGIRRGNAFVNVRPHHGAAKGGEVRRRRRRMIGKLPCS